MIRKVWKFFLKEWKRFLVLLLMSLVLYGFLFFMAYVSDPEKAIEGFSKNHGILLNTFIFMLETTLVYYLLIFVIIMPLIQMGNWKRFLLMLAALYIVRFTYGYWEWVESDEFNAAAVGESKSLIPENTFAWFFMWHVIFMIFDLIICFSVAVAVDRNVRVKNQIILQKQKAEAELLAIKHQINPHFLFNSLSFIYGKAIKKEQEVAHAVLLLADIMRYALNKEEDVQGKVSILLELSHVKNVIEMNQLRYNHQLNIKYTENITSLDAQIIPLVLITLVENAFKHGDLMDPASPLSIYVMGDHDTLAFSIKNKISTGTKELSNGIGLVNVSERLKLMYGSNFSFRINEEAGFFDVRLKIPL